MPALHFLQIFGAVLIAYLPFVGWMSLPWTGDQKVYLNTALEMQEKGSVLIPYLFGESSYYKPPLQYWATLLGMKSLGFSLWGAFVPSVVATFLAALGVWGIAHRVLPSSRDSQVSSHRAALWFLGCVGTATFGIVAQMEIYLVALNLIAWVFAWSDLERSEIAPSQTYWKLYCAFFFVGVLAWVKSPLYSVFWTISYFLFLLFQKRWSELKRPHLYGALACGVLVGSSWYLVVLGLDYDRFISQYLVRETFEKTGGNGSSASQLWLALLGFSIPFTGLFLGSIWNFLRFKNRKLSQYVFAAGAPAAVFFSFYPYRVSTYLFVLLPLFAVLAVAFELERPRLAQLIYRATAILMTAIVGFLLWVLVRIEALVSFPLFFAGITGVVVCFYWVRTIFRPKSMVWSAIALVSWLHLVAILMGERDLSGLREFVSGNSSRSLAMIHEEHHIWHETGLMSLALSKPIAKISRPDEALEILLSGGAIILSEGQADRWITELQKKLRENEDERLVQITHWSRFESRSKLSLSNLLLRVEKLTLSRDFQIITLPQSSSQIPPEWGV